MNITLCYIEYFTDLKVYHRFIMNYVLLNAKQTYSSIDIFNCVNSLISVSIPNTLDIVNSQSKLPHIFRAIAYLCELIKW